MKKANSLFLSIVLSTGNFLITFLPIYVLELPVLAALVLVGIISFVPVIGSIIGIALWIWALFAVIQLPYTGFSLIFYIVFSLKALDILQAVIRTLFNK